MTKYSELLKDPRWQKKRLQVMERDDFSCQKCFDKDNMLVIHHLFYLRSEYHNPWDYPGFALVTLCQDCHNEEHEAEQFNKGIDFVKELKIFGIPDSVVSELIPSFLESVNLNGHGIFQKSKDISQIIFLAFQPDVNTEDILKFIRITRSK